MPTGTIVLSPNPISAADIIVSLQLAGCRCTNSAGLYQTMPHPQGVVAQCHGCNTATIVTPGIASQNLPRSVSITSAGTQTLPSAHGGKAIPVVPSHTAIAAAKAEAARLKAEPRPIDYKDHILVGVREDDGSTKVVSHWPYLPKQVEIDEAIRGAQFKYTNFALCSPVNVW